MKLGTIIDNKFYDSIERLSKAQLPAKTAFKLKNIINSLRKEYASYDEKRNSLILKHSLKNEDGSVKMDGNMPAFSESGLNSFIEEINELTNTDVILPTLKLSELGSNVHMSVEEASVLEDLIELD